MTHSKQLATFGFITRSMKESQCERDFRNRAIRAAERREWLYAIKHRIVNLITFWSLLGAFGASLLVVQGSIYT